MYTKKDHIVAVGKSVQLMTSTRLMDQLELLKTKINNISINNFF